jgi:hypothetical protein
MVTNLIGSHQGILYGGKELVYTSQESLEDFTLMCKRVKIKRMVEEQQFSCHLWRGNKDREA